MSRVPSIHQPNEIRDKVNGNLDTLNKQVPCVNFINASYPMCLSQLTSSSMTRRHFVSRGKFLNRTDSRCMLQVSERGCHSDWRCLDHHFQLASGPMKTGAGAEELLVRDLGF